MTGKTHRIGGVLGCLAGYSILYDKGLLISNVDPLLQLAVMYPYAMYGSTVSDMDLSWESCPSRDIFSRVIWCILHFTTPLRRWLNKGKIRRKIYSKIKPFISLFDSKHRSWQTHSDLFLISSIVLSIKLLLVANTSADMSIIMLMFEGLFFGIISHLLLDLITPDGIWSILLTPIKLLCKGKGLFRLHLVPNSKFFSTNSEESPWESLISKVMWLLCIFLVLRIIYLFSPYRLVFDI